MFLRGNRSRIFMSVAAAALLVSSCGQPEDEHDHAEVESLITKNPSFRWKTNKIPICFMNAGDVDAATVTNLRKHTEAQLARTGVVSLTGWRACTNSDLRSEIVRVRFLIPSRPGLSWGGGISHVGRASVGLGTQNALYAPLTNATTWDSGTSSGGRTVYRVNMGLATLVVYVRKSWPSDSFGQVSQKGTFLHEVGHAIGLFHEQDRTDSNCRISAQPDSSSKLPVGSYDPNSLMNYCASYRVNNGALTAGDIAGIRKLFQ